MKNILIVMLSALLIFVFTSADNAISPLVSIFKDFYQVSEPSVLYLISSCTFGIVVGIWFGPLWIAKYRASRLLWIATIALSFSIMLFIMTSSFYYAIVWRILFGICCGSLAGIIWWITFQGVSGKTTDAMIVVTLTARPAALCLGIPLAAMITAYTHWQVTYVVFLILLLISGLALFYCIKDIPVSANLKSISMKQEYQSIFSTSAFFPLYLGLLFNSFSYFGFYALAGIWFSFHYHLTFIQISTLFLFIGGSEILINFVSPWLYRTFAYHLLFTTICLLDIVAYILFIHGAFPLFYSVLLIIAFIMLNRIILFGVIRTLPTVFSTHANQSTLGSLLTLTLWLGFAIISGIQGKLLPHFGIHVIETILWAALASGITLLLLTHRKWVFQKIEKIV